jgi:flagellar biosynthesis protein FliR
MTTPENRLTDFFFLTFAPHAETQHYISQILSFLLLVFQKILGFFPVFDGFAHRFINNSLHSFFAFVIID